MLVVVCACWFLSVDCHVLFVACCALLLVGCWPLFFFVRASFVVGCSVRGVCCFGACCLLVGVRSVQALLCVDCCALFVVLCLLCVVVLWVV